MRAKNISVSDNEILALWCMFNICAFCPVTVTDGHR